MSPPLVLLLDGVAAPDALADRAEAIASDALAARLADVPAGTTVVVVTAPGGAPAVAAAVQTPAAEGPQGLEVVELGAPEALPAPESESDGPLPGWQRGLVELGGTLDRSVLPMLPDSLNRVAPVRQVFETAGERAAVRTDDGAGWVACGFPDLRRQRSKVLLVRDAEPRPEIIALHRHPVRVGVVCERDEDGYLPSADLDPDPLARERTGQPLRTWGELFALEGDAVCTLRGGRVYRWDGFHDAEMGSSSQALATLVLRWSQR